MTRGCRTGGVLAAIACLLAAASPAAAQLPGGEDGQWRYLGGDAGHIRSNPWLTQINADNFADLEVAWIWRSDNFGPGVEYTARATPVFADGMLYTVAGQRRQVVAIDAASGETLWTFREPGDDALPAFAAHRLRQGSRLCGGRRPGRRLHHLARLLSLGVGRPDRATARGLGRAGGDRHLLAERCRRPHSAPGGRLGSVAGLGRPL